jgi:hypothetical protein
MPLSIQEYLKRGPSTSKEIQAETGLSQTAVSRQLRERKDRIIKLRRGRSIAYVMTRSAFGVNDKLPLSIVHPNGNSILIALIRPLIHGGFFVEPATEIPSLLLGERSNGLYEDLPYFLYDLRPQGFLGWRIAKEMAAQSPEFSPDPRWWNTNQIGRYLISNGDDLPGNLKFGEQALLRLKQKPIPVSDDEYPVLADNVMSGVIPASSAGGEQPKFAVFSKSNRCHVIVKFSPKGENETARRWRDVLLTEYHATAVLHNEGLPAAETRLIENGDRLFLESKRFDRSGEYGRISMVSLQAIDAEYVGFGNNWHRVIDVLSGKGLVGRQDAHDVKALWCFGKLIHNTDMHLGNLSFAIDGNLFRLLLAYDMCSMGFAPRSGGDIPPFNFVPKNPGSFELDVIMSSMKDIARNFWQRVARDERISEAFKEFIDKGNPVDLM